MGSMGEHKGKANVVHKIEMKQEVAFLYYDCNYTYS